MICRQLEYHLRRSTGKPFTLAHWAKRMRLIHTFPQSGKCPCNVRYCYTPQRVTWILQPDSNLKNCIPKSFTRTMTASSAAVTAVVGRGVNWTDVRPTSDWRSPLVSVSGGWSIDERCLIFDATSQAAANIHGWNRYADRRPLVLQDTQHQHRRRNQLSNP